ISQPAMTSAVNRLAQDGLVVREADPVDARAQLVALTATGRKLLEQYRHQVAAVLQPKLEALPPDAYATIERAVGLLDTLTDDLIALAEPTKAVDPPWPVRQPYTYSNSQPAYGLLPLRRQSPSSASAWSPPSCRPSPSNSMPRPLNPCCSLPRIFS